MALVFLGFASFFVLWAGVVYYGKGKNWSPTIRWGGGFIFSALAVSLVVNGASMLFADHSANRVKADSISNVEEAKKFLVGTWTFTERLDPNHPYIGAWEKWVIREDGTADVYSVPPTADGWGSPQRQEYEVLTSKYPDTGQRFYYVRIKGQMVYANIVSDDLLGFKVSASDPVPMKRGDRNPFSK